jgi:peptide/nickel transport system permease protein
MTAVLALLRRPLAVTSLAVWVAFLGACLLAPVLAPFSPTATDLHSVLSGPTGRHWLGTDALGRDVLTRLLYGGRTAFPQAFAAAGTLLVAGVSTGLVAGYLRGAADRVFGWLTDIVLAIPALVVLLTVLAYAGNTNTMAAMVALGLLGSPGLARLVRASTLATRQELYVAAAQVTGVPPLRIMSRHILPRVAGPIVVQVSLWLGTALMLDAGLSYLGFGVQPPNATWGSMLADAANVIALDPWLLVPPGVAIGACIVALALLGDAVRDVTTQRTRGAVRPEVCAEPVVTVVPDPVDDAADGALVRLSNVTVSLPMAAGRRPVITGISLHVGPGETVGLVGESGCGKSVTARAILGLSPAGAVIDGTLTFDRLDLTRPRTLAAVRGKQIGLVSQEPWAGLDPVYPVGRQIGELVRRHHGGDRSAVRARTLDLLRDVNLPDPHIVARRYPHELSGGMAQRVAIAMALAGDPRLLIADEPTTALDVTVQAEILSLLRRLQRDRGMGLLLVSHDLRVVAAECQRVYVLYAGQVVESGPTATVFDTPRHPYTAALLGADLRNASPGQPLPVIPGTVPEPTQWTDSCRFAPRCPLATAECERPIALLTPAPSHQARCVHHDRLAVMTRSAA